MKMYMEGWFNINANDSMRFGASNVSHSDTRSLIAIRVTHKNLRVFIVSIIFSSLSICSRIDFLKREIMRPQWTDGSGVASNRDW